MTHTFAPHRDQSYPVQLSHHSEEDDEYWLAELLDLPGCMADGSSPDDALENLEEAKHLWIETQIEDGDEVPEPTQAHDYSGKFLVRMPKSLHFRLAMQAKREGVSLNQYVTSLLSSRHMKVERLSE
jgi:predicted RNase H-like HicB family nuclease